MAGMNVQTRSKMGWSGFTVSERSGKSIETDVINGRISHIL